MPGRGSNIEEALLLNPFSAIFTLLVKAPLFRSPISGVDYSPRLKKWELLEALQESAGTNGENLLGQERMKGRRLNRKRECTLLNRGGKQDGE